MTMEIILNETEQKLATFLAKSRYKNNRNQNVEDKKIGPQSNELTDLDGIGAEIAFCKLHNVYPDLDINHRPPDDATLRSGHTVDVKTTRYKNGNLLAVPWKEPCVDMFALMVGAFPKYRYVGSAMADDLLSECRITDLGYGDTYAIEQCELFGAEATDGR